MLDANFWQNKTISKKIIKEKKFFEELIESYNNSIKGLTDLSDLYKNSAKHRVPENTTILKKVPKTEKKKNNPAGGWGINTCGYIACKKEYFYIKNISFYY